MTTDDIDLDSAPDNILVAANRAAHSVGRLWQLSFAQGIREGMEFSAQIVEASSLTLEQIENMPEVIREAMQSMLRDISDRIRTSALDVHDPEELPVPQVGGNDA